jgi:hypothetical protein
MRTLAGYVDPSCGMGDHQLLTAPVMQKLGAKAPASGSFRVIQRLAPVQRLGSSRLAAIRLMWCSIRSRRV